MRWPWKRRETDWEVGAAERALQEASDREERAMRLHAQIQARIRENHFGDQIAAIFRGVGK